LETPTPAPRLNAVEGFFLKLMRRRIKRGICHLLIDLLATINCNLAEYNHSQIPSSGPLDPDRIIATAIRRYRGDRFVPLGDQDSRHKAVQKTDPPLTIHQFSAAMD
jgi:hypothetical protein